MVVGFSFGEYMKKAELLNMILALQERVRVLEARSAGVYPGGYVPSIWQTDTCIDGKPHIYPTTWCGITPPHCKRCGQSCSSTTITYSTTSSSSEDEQK